jgi:hypothetical protein
MTQHRPWYGVIYIQVLIAIAIGIFVGEELEAQPI